MLGASGRYGYGRRSEFAVYPDLNYGMNLLQVASFFGGPPNWTPIDVSSIDWDAESQSGEVWIPAGLYMSQYTEMIAIYNSGYDPLNMPPAIKNATAALVRNFLARGGGTTGIKSLQDELLDSTIQRWLDAFKTVLAY
jgi:hypothetical protein